jgi:membrane-associated phospholipid phosphatase
MSQTNVDKPVQSMWARRVSDGFNPLFMANFSICLALFFEDKSVQVTPMAWVSAVFFITLLPMALLRVMVELGWVLSMDVALRQNRYKAFILVSVCFLGAWYMFDSWNLPLTATVTVIHLINMQLSLVITLFWKISMHTGTIASAASLAIYFGWFYDAVPATWIVKSTALVLVFLVPVVTRARLTLSVHTFSQCLVGGIAGFAVTFLEIFYFLP